MLDHRAYLRELGFPTKLLRDAIAAGDQLSRIAGAARFIGARDRSADDALGLRQHIADAEARPVAQVVLIGVAACEQRLSCALRSPSS